MQLFLPQISLPGRPRCGNGRPEVAAERVPAAGSSASAPGPSCTWAQSSTLPLQAAGPGTELAGGRRDHFGPSAESGDWREKLVSENSQGEIWEEKCNRTDGGKWTRCEGADMWRERKVQGVTCHYDSPFISTVR